MSCAERQAMLQASLKASAECAIRHKSEEVSSFALHRLLDNNKYVIQFGKSLHRSRLGLS